MQALDNHYRVTDIIKDNKRAKTRLIHLGFDGGLPLAVWADGWFASSARVREEDGRGEILGDSRLCHGQWLYLDRARLLRFFSQEQVEMGFFRSGPEAEVDTWATLRNSEKIHLSLDALWVPVDYVHLLDRIQSSKAVGQDKPSKKAVKDDQIRQLRERSIKVAVKLKTDGIASKYITLQRIIEELQKENFSDGTPFVSRWRTVEGMKSLLTGSNNPKSSAQFRDAKSTRNKFNS